MELVAIRATWVSLWATSHLCRGSINDPETQNSTHSFMSLHLYPNSTFSWFLLGATFNAKSTVTCTKMQSLPYASRETFAEPMRTHHVGSITFPETNKQTIYLFHTWNSRNWFIKFAHPYPTITWINGERFLLSCCYCCDHVPTQLGPGMIS